MFPPLLYSIVLSLNLLSTPSSSQPQEPFHLLRFRSSLPKSSQLLLPWNHSSSPSSHCRWPGISCYSNQDFRVKSLNLTSFGLSGVLENSISSICELQDLIFLDLSGNKFSGGVPAVFGNCSLIDTLLLNDNALSGPIPPQIFTERMVMLDLGFNQISGPIPHEVGQCRNLEYIGLYNNLLTGGIPHELFSLPNLEFLYLSTNNLSGTLPDFPSSCLLSELRIHENPFNGSLPISLSNCHNLRILFATSNNLGGIIPTDFFKGLPKLEKLYLSENHFEGEIPESIWSLRNLQEIVLLDNNFNGSVSDDIRKCSQLNYLDLSGNKLTNRIPASICSLKNLNYLYLYNNMFNDSLPLENGNCSSIIEFRFDINQITGTIPSSICELVNTKVFHVSDNLIEGRIPDCIERLTSLEELGLYSNRFTGEIPSGIGKLTNLTYLSLAHNNLTGTVPSDLGMYNVPGLIRLDLTGNNLIGEIPSGVCSGGQLQVLTLGNNQFNGSFPAEIVRCKSLHRVILEYNLLQGSIPEDIGNSSSISHFNIKGNLLHGNIPKGFGFWSNLSTLDLSENQFSGSIPREFGKLGNLVELRISSNRLRGEIPPELNHCPRLSEIDLSKNGLSGSIPSEIVSASKLEIIRLQDNQLAGVIPNSLSRSQSLRELQLGNNKLEGSIPCSLTSIDHFNTILNLSMNRLSGEIPSCLGDLHELVNLDISSNKFSGEIPLDVNRMAALLFLNISFNDFQGKIPSSWEKILNEHLGSSLGNPRLCIQTSVCESGRKSHKRGFILAGILTGSVLLIACLLASLYVLAIRVRHSDKSSDDQSPLNSRARSEDLPKELCFEDIVRATEGWNDKYVIGRGKHGIVYRTESTRSKKQWAVKKVDLSETKSCMEMRTLSLVRHRNVVRMGGYSIRDGYGVIVTDYMPGGTLYDVLHQRRPLVVLDWETRWRIALGITQGLSYLHHDCVPQIIHRDIKSDNIFLDAELEPKIGDFGMAKLECDDNESKTVSAIVGTLGYIAPENAYSTKLTEKCDVYSYGVVLLELVCRKLPVDPSFEEGLDIVSWVRTNLRSSNDSFCCLDAEIQQWDKRDQREAMEMIDVALRCTEMVPEVRPSMRHVVGSILKIHS